MAKWKQRFCLIEIKLVKELSSLLKSRLENILDPMEKRLRAALVFLC